MPHRGRYAAFASERGGVLKNRALLDDESGDSREQRRKMRMEDADNKNRTCRNGHNVFGVADHVTPSRWHVPVPRPGPSRLSLNFPRS